MALDSLEKTVVVGMTDRFDESVMILRRHFDWKLWKVWYIAVNQGSNRPLKPTLADEDRDSLNSVNQMDLEIFRAGRKLFERNIKGRYRPRWWESFFQQGMQFLAKSTSSFLKK